MFVNLTDTCTLHLTQHYTNLDDHILQTLQYSWYYSIFSVPQQPTILESCRFFALGPGWIL